MSATYDRRACFAYAAADYRRAERIRILTGGTASLSAVLRAALDLFEREAAKAPRRAAELLALHVAKPGAGPSRS